MSADPLARLLGFDPDSGAAVVEVEKVVERVVERVVEVPAAPPTEALPGGVERTAANTTLADAITLNPEWVLYLALRQIFRAAPAKHRKLPLGGAYEIARQATCWALRELAANHREVAASGWIVGKRDNPHT